jgi:hypothetical protein
MLKVSLRVGANLSKQPGERINNYSEIEEKAQSLIAFLDDRNGKFIGIHQGAYALSDCQVQYDDVKYKPSNFFVVADNMVGHEGIFESRIIINPELLETPAFVEKEIPTKKTVKDGDKVKIVLDAEKKKLSNRLRLQEACISFPHRQAKNMNRFYRIKVRYQIPVTGVLSLFGLRKLKTIETYVEALKAHIFQHEIMHAAGQNIYHNA